MFRPARTAAEIGALDLLHLQRNVARLRRTTHPIIFGPFLAEPEYELFLDQQGEGLQRDSDGGTRGPREPPLGAIITAVTVAASGHAAELRKIGSGTSPGCVSWSCPNRAAIFTRCP